MMKGTALALVSGALLMGLLFYPQSVAEVTVVSLPTRRPTRRPTTRSRSPSS